MHAFITRSVEQPDQQRSPDEAGGASEQCAANIWGRIGRGHRSLYKVPRIGWVSAGPEVLSACAMVASQRAVSRQGRHRIYCMRIQ